MRMDLLLTNENKFITYSLNTLESILICSFFSNSQIKVMYNCPIDLNTCLNPLCKSSLKSLLQNVHSWNPDNRLEVLISDAVERQPYRRVLNQEKCILLFNLLILLISNNFFGCYNKNPLIFSLLAFSTNLPD